MTTLHILDEAVEKAKSEFPGLRIIYRPHPWRHKRACPDLFMKEDFHNVMLDSQISHEYYQRRTA